MSVIFFRGWGSYQRSRQGGGVDDHLREPGLNLCTLSRTRYVIFKGLKILKGQSCIIYYDNEIVEQRLISLQLKLHKPSRRKVIRVEREKRRKQW